MHDKLIQSASPHEDIRRQRLLNRLTRRSPAVLSGLPLLLMLTACASGFSIALQESGKYTATSGVELLFDKPARPHRVIASFEGKEQDRCPRETPYCSLRRSAQEIGAHAILVTHVDRYQYPGDWVSIEGRLTRLYPYESERIKGVLIRYTADEASTPTGK